MKVSFISDHIDTRTGRVPRVSSELNRNDKWNNFRVRLGIRRMSYKVEPGIYAVGNPTPDSVVLVSANYKLSFDTLRRELKGIDAWILVLDTKGINVWCAAGKGTFGTQELVDRIRITKLKDIINHKKLILPQLGATGVSAHNVKKLSGFTVLYGPVRASDISGFLEAGMKATPEMRQVKFTVYNRLLLVPVEIAQGLPKLLIIIIVFLLLSGINSEGYSIKLVGTAGLYPVINLFAAFLTGVLLAPLLLPWIPGRSFSFKGIITGFFVFVFLFLGKFTGNNLAETAAWLFIITVISSFLTMTFTGSSTYTSLSGVKKEMKIAVPFQIAGAVVGTGLWIVSRFM